MIQFPPTFRFRRFLAAGLVIGFGMLSSCAHESELSPVAPQPAMAVGVDCEPGSEMTFPLETNQTGPISPDYEAYLSTPPFQSDDCLCQVQNYFFVFTDVTPGDVITVTDANGNILDYDLIEEPPYTKIEVFWPGDLPDQDMAINIDFGSAPVENVVPTLEDAGGLCIIENVGGMPTGPTSVIYYVPLKVQHAQSGGGEARNFDAYIPSAMGTLNSGTR